MKNINKLIVIITFLTAAGAPAQDNLTLSKSLELGLENSKDLKISNSKIIGSDANVEVVNSQFFPTLKFSANYTRLSDVPPFQISLPIFPQPITLAETILNNYTFKLAVQQPIFTGFRLSSQKRSAEYLRDATKIDHQKDKNEAALTIQTSFWNYEKALEVKTVVDDNIKTVEKHLQDTRNFYANGLATRNDVLKLEVQLSNTKLAELDAENNIDLARTAFNKAVGLSLSAKTTISSPVIVVNDSYTEFSGLVNEAYNSRDELRSTQERIKANEESVSANKSGYFPQVFINADYYYNRPNSRYQPPLDQFKGTWDLGVTLSWDIWTWGSTSNQVIQAQQNLVQSKLTLDEIKDNIELEVNQNYLALKYSKEKLEVLKETIEQSRENLKITDDKYNNQLATSSDLIDAENSVFSSETNYKTALVDYQIAKVKLDKALGRKIY